jgi:hypothetical protein
VADTSWRPRGSAAGVLGLATALVLGLAAATSALFAIRQAIGFAMFLGLLVGVVCAALALLVLVLTVGYFQLRYRFEPEGLAITWLGRRDLVPYDRVDGIFAGQRLGQTMRVRGLNWPGFHVGVGRTRSMGFVRYFVTTGDLSEIALIVTPDLTVAVSPADAAGFRRELIRRVEESEPELIDPVQERASTSSRPLSALRDVTLPALHLAGVALLASTILYIWLHWPTAEILVLQAPALTPPAQCGQPGVVCGTRADIFKLPGTGAAILIANLGIGLAIYARERAAARMLWATSVVVQVLILVATARILH